MKFSVVIPTFNRAEDLRGTLASLAGQRPASAWEVIVADNNSTDDTREVVTAAARTFPVELRYVFEREQGRSAALNTGIALARGEIIVTTDDDVRVEADWLDRAGESLDVLGCDYVGGKVLPIWGAPKPEWIPDHGGKQWAVIALLDYGPDPIPFFTLAHRVPIGVNMAFRRDAFARAGLWDNRVGRKKGTLLGQEVREWMMRAKAAGLTGFYAPAMVVRHVIQRDRLQKRYFRRWYYWNGISRALLYRDAWIDMQAPEDAALDFSRVPHILGVPRFFYRKVLREIRRMVVSAWHGDKVESFDAELWLFFFAGVLRQRWRDRKLPRPERSARGLVAAGPASVSEPGT
ncbi:MAG TPA: glycosyltransferase family 2 protein [Vicinamibacterales bacterium]|nr:glycosyltransferase family 2 protein [Vicinamibacterales bacterium]